MANVQQSGDEQHKYNNAETELRAAKQEWEDIFQAIGHPSLILGPDHRIIACNKAVEKVTGKSKEQLIGKKCCDVFHKKNEPPNACPMEKLLQSSHFETVEMEMEALDRTFLVSCTPVFDKSGALNRIIHIATDITEHKRTEEKLRESEKHLRFFVEHTPAAVAMFDTQMRYIIASKRWFTDYNLEDQNIIGRSHYEVFPEISETLKEIHRRCLAGEIIRHDNDQFIRQDGKTDWVSWETHPWRNFNGEIGGIIIFSEVITKRKQAEEKLRESESAFRTLFEAGAEGILVADLKSRKFKYANPAICRMLGYTEAELTTMGVNDIHPRESLEYVTEQFESQVKGDKILAADIPCQRKDGTILYVNITGTKGTIGGEECNIGFFTDVTDFRHIRETLREEKDRAQKYLDIAAVMLVAIDTTGVIKLINKKGCEILGRDETQIIEKNWFDNFLPESVRDSVKAAFAQLMAGKTASTEYFENPVLRHNGEERVIAWHNTLLRDEAENITGTLSSGEDITERKHAEQKLQDNQKRLKALASELTLVEERERRRIALGIHDNLGQKLVMVKFRLQALKESLSDRKMQNALDNECIMMGDILDDIHSLTFELSNPLLYELGFESAIKSWLKTEIQKNAGLKCEFTSDDKKIELDEDIKVILFKATCELLINIIKHAKARTVKVGIAKQYNEVEVTVEDDGAGFDVTRLGLPSGKKGGFGLFSIKERLEYIGGRLEIKSSPGKGTRVLMTAPAKKPEHGWQEVKINEDTDSR